MCVWEGEGVCMCVCKGGCVCMCVHGSNYVFVRERGRRGGRERVCEEGEWRRKSTVG